MTSAKTLLEDDDAEPTIKINEGYAKRFEHNKRREELHRLQEKHPELAVRLARKAALEAARATRQQAAAGGSADTAFEDTEESSTDEDDGEISADDDTDKVLETLVRIKYHDPAVYRPDMVLFPADESSKGDDADKQAEADGVHRSKQARPVYLRTVLAQQALAGGASSSDDEGREGRDYDDLPRQPASHSYAAEQQALKEAFLQAAEAAELAGEEAGEKVPASGGLLKKKAGATANGAGYDDGKQQQVNKLLDEYFGTDDDLDEASAFLKAYIANKAWKEPGDGELAVPILGRKRQRAADYDSEGHDGGDGDADGVDGTAGDDEDEQFLEEVDRFEAAYNFRFEEPGSHRIQSFPRVIADSVRRPDDRRKRQRDAKAARQAAEKDAREAEIKRLKNLKSQEIEDMLSRIQHEAGIKSATLPDDVADADAAYASGLAGLLNELLEGDFDPEEYDRRMAAAFDKKYYEEEEQPDELFGDQEEELADEADIEAPAAAAVAGNATAAPDGFAALRQKLKQQQEDEAASDEEGDANADVAAAAEQRNQLQRALEEYYKLDCEDNIGGLACRFRYREVPKENFGLTDDDILALPDKQLNQIAGLKLIAPYRENSKKLRPNYKALQSIKGMAAATTALRKQRKDREKWKEKKRQQKRKQQQGAGQQHQQEGRQQQQRDKGNSQQQQQQWQQGQKREMEQRVDGQQKWQQFKQRPQKQQQKQQKPLTQMTAEEKQAARLASYAKLTLKPSTEQQHQQDGPQASGGSKYKKRKTGHQQQDGQQGKCHHPLPAATPGRLASLQLQGPLTKAQKKNLLRSLKRKESQKQQ